ncbi:MAG: S16 family serine protease [archaeon]|jgi:uncharacterized protein
MIDSKRFTFFTQLFLIFLFLVLLTTPALAILQNGDIKIFAVTEDNKGMAAELYIYTIPGSGKIAFITSNSLVGKDTQTTGNISIQISKKLTNIQITDKDIIFDIRANASEVDGPSAGAAMTLLTYSMLSEKTLNPVVALTGTINVDGSIGMVGGVGPKSVAAAEAGVKLFLIPSGEAVADIEENGSMKTVNLLEYGPQKLGMKIVEVSTIEQAIGFAYSDISSIKVDSNNANLQIFIPKPISYSPSLAPMEQISQNYITQAQAVIDDAKNALEKSTIPDDLRATLYQRHSATKRSVEMAQRFLDQNYLYSAANYAFNARVMAGAIKEIAENPSLISSDVLLGSKISQLEKEIALVKQQMDFVSISDFEWVIGAQQRIAYAENALANIKSTLSDDVNAPQVGTANDQKIIVQEIYFEKVYEFESAVAWTSVAQDFLSQARKMNSKKIPFYSNEFVALVKSKLIDVNKLISDSNVSQSSVDEATRRYNSAKVSFDNNFFFAAIYDAFFAEAFILGETNRKNIDQNKLFGIVASELENGENSNSVWASLFFDHAKFYYENAAFNIKLGRTAEVVQSTMTSYDLIFLSKKIVEAKKIIMNYVSSAPLQEYVENEPIIDVKYTKRDDTTQYLLVLLMLLIILLVSLILLFGLASKARENKLTYDSRKSKIGIVLSNLDKALSSKKISDAEYFFMKKKYEDELNQSPGIGTTRKRSVMNIDDLRGKLRALERGIIDLRRHYKEGLIIPEDYEKHYAQVHEEILDIKSQMRFVQEENRLKQKSDSPVSKLMKRFSKAKDSVVKGTEELVEDEKRGIFAEKVKRRKLLKKYSTRQGKD